MRLAYITAGAAGMYCGTCLHDNTLAAALIERGHEVALLPTYTPTRTDEENVSDGHIFFGAINVYLQQRWRIFRRTPWFVDRLLDNRRLLRWVSRFAGATDAAMLGTMTVAMLEGEHGPTRKELEKLVRWLEHDYRPQVVHLSQTLFLGLAHEIRERLGVPVVCSLQGEDLFYDDLVEPYRSRALELLAERAGDVDAFTAPSHYYADHMAGYGIPRERIHLARLGIDARGYRGERPAEPADAEAPVTVGYFARIAPEKGLHLLLDAFERLMQDDDGRLRLEIAGYVGDAEYFAAQQQRIASWGLDGRVELHGEVDRDGKIDFLAGLDLLAVPTVYQESKGLFVLEALASGVPTVLPAHGAFPEWIENTGGGVLHQPGSADSLATELRALADDPARRHRLGTAGRQAVLTRYDRFAMADDMISLYEGLVNQSGQIEPDR